MAKSSKKKTTSEEDLRVAALIASLEKSHGKGIIQTMSGPPGIRNYPYQVPTGSLGLDIAIGPMRKLASGHWQTGDMPGSITEVFGPEGCGKTTLTLTRIANYQAMKLRCAMLDMEHNLDPHYAVKLGVNMQELYWSQPNNGEQCIDIAHALLQSGLFHLVVIDSIAAMVPKAELENDSGEFLVGAHARIMSQFTRKMMPLMGANAKGSLFCTNQIRFKVGKAAGYGNPETQPGGNAMKYAATFRLDMRRIGSVVAGGGETDDDGAGRPTIGQKVRVKVIKNKVSPPFRVAEFNLIYGQGIDTCRELFKLAVLNGMIQQNGAWYTLPGEAKPIQGEEDVMARIREDAGLTYRLYDAILTRNMASVGLQPDGNPIPGVTMASMPVQHTQFEPPTPDDIVAMEGQDTEDPT